MTAKSNKTKKYFLVCSEIKFTAKDTAAMTHKQNALVTLDTTSVNIETLGKAQQAVQLAFHKIFGSDVTVLDVYIANLIFLGDFTEKEFFAKTQENGNANK